MKLRDFFQTVLETCFFNAFWSPFSAFWTPKGAKRVPIGDNFWRLWGYRWKCENDGFVYTKPSFSWLEEVPRDPRSLKKIDSKTYTEKIPKKHKKYRKLLPKGTPRGGQKAVNEPTFSSLFRLGPFGGALGSPRVAKRPQQTPKYFQNDTKMTPEGAKMTSQIVNQSISQPAIHSVSQSVSRSGSQSVGKSVNQPVRQSVSQQESQPVSHSASQ